MEHLIFCDMDEVLCDFVGGVCEAWSVERQALLDQWVSGEYDIIPPLSRALNLEKTMTEEVFWSRINGSPRFWEDLKLLPWTMELMDYLKSRTDHLLILTSPSQCPHSYCGKAKWFSRHLNLPLSHFIPWGQKHRLATSRSVLIDDRQETVKLFRQYGGKAILFPHHHNSLHHLKDDPLFYVSYELNQLLRSNSCT